MSRQTLPAGKTRPSKSSSPACEILFSQTEFFIKRKNKRFFNKTLQLCSLFNEYSFKVHFYCLYCCIFWLTIVYRFIIDYTCF